MEKLFALSSIGLVTGIAGTVLTAQQVDAVPAGAQMAGEQGYSVTDFQSVTAVGPNAVVISVGAAPSVRASGGQEALDLYEVVVEDGEFKIQPKDENSWVGHRPRLEPGTYYVTVPRLSGATLTGSGDAALTVNGNADVSIVGSGDVDIGGSASCAVSRMGSGKVRCDG